VRPGIDARIWHRGQRLRLSGPQECLVSDEPLHHPALQKWVGRARRANSAELAELAPQHLRLEVRQVASRRSFRWLKRFISLIVNRSHVP